jgi:hypothetical protein
MTEMGIQKCSMAPHGACKLKTRRVQDAVLARLFIARDVATSYRVCLQSNSVLRAAALVWTLAQPVWGTGVHDVERL